jgi:hypothetical protein
MSYMVSNYLLDDGWSYYYAIVVQNSSNSSFGVSTKTFEFIESLVSAPSVPVFLPIKSSFDTKCDSQAD